VLVVPSPKFHIFELEFELKLLKVTIAGIEQKYV